MATAIIDNNLVYLTSFNCCYQLQILITNFCIAVCDTNSGEFGHRQVELQNWIKQGMFVLYFLHQRKSNATV